MTHSSDQWPECRCARCFDVYVAPPVLVTLLRVLLISAAALFAVTLVWTA